MSPDARQMNSLTLAYIGDAVYELFIRERLINRGMLKPEHLHRLAVGYVAADKQAAVIYDWLNSDLLDEVEKNVVKRGRNAKSPSTPKNMSITDYRHATAFETLLGYHHFMDNDDRLIFLMETAANLIDERSKNDDGRD